MTDEQSIRARQQERRQKYSGQALALRLTVEEREEVVSDLDQALSLLDQERKRARQTLLDGADNTIEVGERWKAAEVLANQRGEALRDYDDAVRKLIRQKNGWCGFCSTTNAHQGHCVLVKHAKTIEALDPAGATTVSEAEEPGT